MTHTLEVVQHARTLARTLLLNEDLCEAIALAHDVGHTPFGHSGEAELNELMADEGGFDHNLQSLRIVDKLEKRYAAYDGLNLCHETREGIARHHTPYDNPPEIKEFSVNNMPSLEAQIVDIADVMAYCAHDMEDAFEAGYISIDQVDDLKNPLWQDVRRQADYYIKCYNIKDPLIENRLVIRYFISTLNLDVMKHTQQSLKLWNVNSVDDVQNLEQPLVSLSPQMNEPFNNIREFLLEEVYNSSRVLIMTRKARNMIKKMFNTLLNDPRRLPSRTYHHFRDEGKRAIADFIAGMTDRYALDFYEMMFNPRERVMPVYRNW
jgi:dGTPase